MRLAQFFCTSTSQNLSVSFHLSALMTTSRSHRAASTIHSTGRAEFLLLGTCRGPSGSYSSWQNCSLQQLVFYSTRTHIATQQKAPTICQQFPRPDLTGTQHDTSAQQLAKSAPAQLHRHPVQRLLPHQTSLALTCSRQLTQLPCSPA